MGRKEKEDRDHERERDRDRDRDARKRRHRGASSRSRSRSKSKERDYSKKIKTERDVPSEKHREHEKDRARDTRDKERSKKMKEEKLSTSDVPESPEKGKKQKSKQPENEVSASASSEGSISIEETNRIRAELGLKPLDLGGDSETSTKKEDVHVPAENIGQKKATEELRRRIEEKREKRKIEQRFAKANELGEVSDEDDNAASWVEKLRRIQQAKEEAAKRAKMLEEMDEALGEAGKSEASKPPPKAYTSRDLQGIRVEHDREEIAEEKTVILTLKDQNVLDEEADVLVNVNLMDEERYKKNNEIKKQRPGYQPFEEEFDELGLPKKKSLLAKYDVEIEGEKKESFVLGHDADEEAKRTKELIKEKLQQQQKKFESLESRPLQMASEYFTPEEMVSFKKVKRRVKKVRSKGDQVLKADDLLATTPGEVASSDLGSRNRRIKTEPDDDFQLPTEDLSEVRIVNDETAPEERLALNKVKRFKDKMTVENKWDLKEIAMTIKQEPTDEPEPMEEDNAKTNITLNATAEFCRTLGDIPTYGMSGNRDEGEEDLLDFERQLAEERRKNQEKEERKREAERRQEHTVWKGIEQSRQDDSDASMDTDQHEQDAGTVILDEEPDVGVGMVAALKLAMNKGYLEKEEKKRVALSKAAQELSAQRYTIEDKTTEDDKYSRRNRFDGPVSEFKDKEGYKPQFKLEYVDDGGKQMNEKEAFRFLSHKFHGKGSGKLKSEKRAKKQEEKMLMNRMSSTDTPLNTLKKLQDKQKELQSPYVVLSGKNATTSIAKAQKPAKGKK